MKLLALTAVAVAGCYSPPEPQCGFVCGPHNTCPADYTCAADRHCHLDGAPASLDCGPPPDAAIDAPPGPQILATEPTMGMTGVSVAVMPTAIVDQMIVQFDPIDVTMKDGANNPVEGRGDSPIGSEAVRFLPMYQLVGNTQYTVTISAAVLATYGPVGPFAWSFTTGGDNIAPFVTFIDPPGGATGIGTGTVVSVDFDEVVQSVDTTSFTITDGVTPVVGTISSIGGHSYVFTPTAALAAATTYTVDLSPAIHDLAGNPLADYSFSFTTQ